MGRLKLLLQLHQVRSKTHETHEHKKQEASFALGSPSFAGRKESPALALALGFGVRGLPVTSAVFCPANPNPAGGGGWTRIFYGECEL